MIFAFLIANSSLYRLDFNTTFLQPSLGRTACPPYISKDALPFCPFGTFPHTVGNPPFSAELSQLDRNSPAAFKEKA